MGANKTDKAIDTQVEPLVEQRRLWKILITWFTEEQGHHHTVMHHL